MKKYLKNIMWKFMKLILIFIRINFHKNFHKNEHECILYKIGIYFSWYNLVAEVDEKGHTDRDLIF